jgi:hypothetical protein
MEPDLISVNLRDADLENARLQGVNLEGANFGNARSFYKAKLDTNILSEIKTKWPEKLATVWDDTKQDWVIDDTLLEQVKKPDWHGW